MATKKTKSQVTISGKIVDGAKASTHGSCTNTRILKSPKR
jgi:hypothetical protein